MRLNSSMALMKIKEICFICDSPNEYSMRYFHSILREEHLIKPSWILVLSLTKFKNITMKKNLLLIAFIFNLSLGFSQGSCSANFSINTSACPTLNFTDNSTSSSAILYWGWDFGDGGSTFNQNPSHTYSSNGTYLVCLTIATADSCYTTFCDTVDVNCIGVSQCQADFNYSAASCPSIAFTDASTSNPGSVNYWVWDFGDGGTSTMQNPTHTYTANGNYLTCLTIWTSDSCSSTVCDTVTINCLTNELNETILNNISVYPNPTSDVLKIDIDFNSTLNYSIVTLKGQNVKNGVLPGSGEHTISVTNLIDGVYFIEFSIDDQKKTIRFVKE